jgi:hypothetical protein
MEGAIKIPYNIYKIYMITKNTISKLNHFIILQYIESSFESHCMVVPKNPNIPEPKMPPPPLVLEPILAIRCNECNE